MDQLRVGTDSHRYHQQIKIHRRTALQARRVPFKGRYAVGEIKPDALLFQMLPDETRTRFIQNAGQDAVGQIHYRQAPHPIENPFRTFEADQPRPHDEDAGLRRQRRFQPAGIVQG